MKNKLFSLFLYIKRAEVCNSIIYVLTIKHIMSCFSSSVLQLHTPLTMGIYGGTGSGKTVFVQKLLSSDSFDKKPQKIVYCYTEWQPLFEEMEKEGIEFYEGLPTKDEVNGWSAEREHMVLVLDDMIHLIVNNTDVLHYFTVTSHHRNMSIIILSQNIFSQGKTARTISLNMHYIVLFKNIRDTSQVMTLARQIFPSKTKYFMDAYQKSTDQKYGYLLIDISPHTDKTFQLRTCILKDETCIVYIPK